MVGDWSRMVVRGECNGMRDGASETLHNTCTYLMFQYINPDRWLKTGELVLISMIDRDIHGSIQQALRSFYITVQLINKVHQHYKDTTRSLYYLTNLKVIPQRILVFVNY